MTSFVTDYTYVNSNGTGLFTVTLLPNANGKFPCVVFRSPYVDAHEPLSETEICIKYLEKHDAWLARGYAVVYQHCRGRGKSEGDCIPYINEQADSRALYDWIRTKAFYNGELFLCGSSYTSSVHFCAAPYADDVKGAVFGVQDVERYNICYRNGFMKKGLHGNWYVGMYKAKSKMPKHYTEGAFETLPLRDFSQTVFGESVADFDEMLKSPNPTDAFWQTHAGGTDARDALKDLPFPALFTTAFYDLYTGGIFDMWNRLSESARAKCALVVSPNNHGDTPGGADGILFPRGTRKEAFGVDYEIDWFDSIRRGSTPPFQTGKVTYYRVFENQWATDDFATGKQTMTLPLGDRSVSYTYNPYDPPRFKGGLSCNFGGSVYQDRPNSRHDVISVYTDRFSADHFVKGKMAVELSVSSDCPDTCFYVRLSIEKERGDYGLRDDITSLCYQLGDYLPGTEVRLQFSFDEHAFLVRRGERLRIDIASADANHYVRHTNQKGLYSEQTMARIAHNTVHLQGSFLHLPIEEI